MDYLIVYLFIIFVYLIIYGLPLLIILTIISEIQERRNLKKTERILNKLAESLKKTEKDWQEVGKNLQDLQPLINDNKQLADEITEKLKNIEEEKMSMIGDMMRQDFVDDIETLISSLKSTKDKPDGLWQEGYNAGINKAIEELEKLKNKTAP